MQPPIADPYRTPSSRFSGGDVRLFRSKFLPYYFFTLMIEFVWIGPFLAFAIHPVFAPHPERFAPTLAIVAVAIATVMLFFCALSYWLAPVKISAWGMRAYSFWSAPREVSWPEITSAQFVWRGYSYMVVRTSSQQKLWIFLPLQNPRAFAQAVAAQTAPEHPLHLFLRQRGLLN